MDRILVVVNDEIITEGDLRSAMEPIAAQYRATLSGEELDERLRAAEEELLNTLIDDHLIVSAAKREANVTVEESEIDAMFDEFHARFPSEDVFQRVLKEQRISFKKLRDRFREQILKRKMIDYKVRSRISVSPGDVHDYYHAHPDEFVRPGRARVRHILIRIGDLHDEKEAGELAEAIYQKAAQGEDFSALAKTYSGAANAELGGDMGWVEKGQFRGDIDEALFELEVGGVAPPIHTQLGYHLFKVEDREPPAQMPLEEAQNLIERTLYKIRMGETFDRYLAELRQDAYIAYQK